jgi:Tfp pilus assembly protein PilX
MTRPPFPARTQRGAVLYVALVLLVILALGALFTVQTSLSEQRSATSDARTKVTSVVAESGIEQAIEYMRMHQEDLLPEPGTLPTGDWTACATDDTSFPCGAIDPNTADSATRGLYYAYTGGSNDAGNAAAEEVDERSLPLAQSFTQVGDFDVTYSVGAVICPVDFETIGTASTVCTSDPDKSNSFAVTLVSTGQIAGESARSTVSVGLTQYRVINPNPNVPPVVSSSVISGLGNATIVANPNGNSMGNLQGSQGGWPISAWSRSTIGGTGGAPSGSFQTCEAADYFDSSTTLSDNGIRLCDSCSCKAIVSSKSLGEGRDILDRDDTDGSFLSATDATLAPNYQFPCDLFAYTFGVDARENKVTTDAYSDVPALCETMVDTDPSTTTSDIEDFLAANFTKGDDCQSELVDKSEDGGLFWYPKGCAFKSGSKVGSPEHPVVIIADGSFKNSGPTLYGVVFIRDPAKTYDPTKNGGSGAAGYGSGGGNGIIYGAVVIEGDASLNGGLKVISSPEIMQAIANSNNNLRLARVPGSWNDSLSY